ncbi:hypothetical protein GIB67_029530 [Kingdonia uniflora]|uniref:Uncharacterized protein n=1 Tax=Kingdonia uniflora TaxID=39325 RepID=A0A7J7NYP7_9MAGN|nr:hypothetical protein GIB67_029530 [Kingdonia uniflora]
MASILGCAKADEADLVGKLTPVIGVGYEEDTEAESIECPCLKGFRVEYPTGSNRFREFCKAKRCIDGIWGHAFAYRGNFFRTCSVSQGGDYLYLLPDLAQEKMCRHLGDEVSLEYIQGVVKDSRTDGFCCYLAQFNYGMTMPLSNLAKSVMNWIGDCPAQLNCNFWEVILVCETLNGRWAASGSERKITARDFLENYAVKYVTATDSAYLSSSSSRPCFFDLSSAGRVWNDNLLWVSGKCLQRSDEEPLELNNRTITKGINCKVSRKESFIGVVSREGTGPEAILKVLEISRLKRVASKDDKLRRSQAKWRLVGKTPGSMEEKLLTPKLNIPLKLAWLNEIPDGPVDVATVCSTVVRNLAKRKAIKRRVVPRSVISVSVDDSSKRRKFARALRDVQLGFQERLMELEKRISQLKGEKNQLEENLIWERGAFQLVREKEKEGAALKLKEVRAESEAKAERLVTASAMSQNNLAGMLYQLRYTKAEIMEFSKGNYEEKEIMDEEEVGEREDGLNIAEKAAADNQETINQEIESSRLRVENLEGLLEVEKKSPAELQKELVLLEREKSRLICIMLSMQKNMRKKAASGSRHEAELVEYRIRALNEEISDMKCNIRALNEQLLKREIEQDTAQTNLAVSEADFEKLSSSIMGKDRELRNSVQICDSLIARIDRVKADLSCLKGRETHNRADLAEIQGKNKSLVDYLAHAWGNVRRVVQRENEMNERINQLYVRISESERELRVREMKYQNDLKFELDKRDGEISSGAGSREMKEFLRRKEKLVENMRIDLTNSRQKSIDLTRQTSERIDQLITELTESKARHLKDNKRAAVTHQAFKEIVVREQEKCDGEALHQRQLSAFVAFIVEEIKFLQVERDLMQDCFSRRTCVCKLDITSIDPIGVMDRGIGITAAEQIVRGREIVVERAPKYMASRTKIGGSLSAVSPTPVVGGRSTAFPSRKSCRA